MNNSNKTNLIKVLIATCDKELEDLLLKELSNYEVCLICFQKSNHALLAIVEDNFDFAIIDDDLEGVKGYKIIPFINRIRPKLPVIHLYSKPLDTSQHKMKISLKIPKPINLYKVSEISKRIVNSYINSEITN